MVDEQPVVPPPVPPVPPLPAAAVTVSVGDPFHAVPLVGVTVTGNWKFWLLVSPGGAVTVIDDAFRPPPVSVKPVGSADHIYDEAAPFVHVPTLIVEDVVLPDWIEAGLGEAEHVNTVVPATLHVIVMLPLWSTDRLMLPAAHVVAGPLLILMLLVVCAGLTRGLAKIIVKTATLNAVTTDLPRFTRRRFRDSNRFI